MKAPAFQFYAADYLADESVSLMSLEAEGAYIRLLAFCWREGTIPANPGQLSRLCKGASKEAIEELLPCFYPDPNQPGRLLHKRLEAEREKQEQHRLKQAENGKKGGRPPLPNPPPTQPKPEEKPKETQNKAVGLSGETQTEPKKSSSSSSSILSTNKDTINTGVTPPAMDRISNEVQEVLSEVPKTDSVDIKYKKFITWFNNATERHFKGDKPSRSAFGARLKEGYTAEQFKKAVLNCLADPWHKQNANHLTPEFITRSDKLEKYLNAQEGPKKETRRVVGVQDIYDQGEFIMGRKVVIGINPIYEGDRIPIDLRQPTTEELLRIA